MEIGTTELPKILVTERAEAPVDKTILPTPTGVADIEVVAMSVWAQVAIRGLRTYLQSLVGFLAAGGTGAATAVGVNLPAGDFYRLCLTASGLALAPTVISVLQNAVEILSKLDVSKPQLRG